MGRVTRLWPRQRWLLGVGALMWLMTAACSTQPGGAAGGVTGGINTVLANPPGTNPNCWACVNDWCNGNPIPCNQLVMILCNQTMISILCPSQYPGAGNTTRQGLMNWISNNSGGQVPAAVNTAINDLCLEAARQVARNGGTC